MISLKAKLLKVINQEGPFVIGVPAFLWQALFFYIPLFFIIIWSVLNVSDDGSVVGLTLENFTPFFSRSYIFIILKSLLLALANSVLCFIVGFPVAYFLSFKAGNLKNIFLFLLILPFWTNFLLHIYAWFFVLERGGFLNTLLLRLGIISEPLVMLHTMTVVMLVMVYSYLPFMVLPIYSILERFDRGLLEASYDLGANTWQSLIRILLPLTRSGILLGFFLVFVPSFGEFVIPGLLGGDKFMFVGTVISHYILGNVTLSLGAAFTLISCLVLLGFAALAYLVVNFILKRRDRNL
jgi:spermidine/putrescine transport system permease protein